MATVLHVTKQNETVDLACWLHYGRTRGVTELVLDTNPGLAAKGPILPMGTAIAMPVVAPQDKQSRTVKLWD